MKNLILTHNDLDGWMSAIIVERAVGESIVKCDANPTVAKTNEMAENNSAENIYILDRQCPDLTELWNASVEHYDHHIGTAIEGVIGRHDTSMAACMIVAEEFAADEIYTEFAKYASLWDTFQWKQASPKDAQKAINFNKIKLMYDTYEEFRDSLIGHTIDSYLSLHAEALVIADKEERKYISHKLSTIKPCEFRGIKAGFFTWEKLPSQISDEYLTANKDVDIAIGYNAEYNSISFRSKLTDVSIIAKEFGGGGHPKAAGCTPSGELIDFVRQFILC